MKQTTRLAWVWVLPLAGLWVSTTHASAQQSRPRQVAAPASDIASGVVRLPDPAASATVSQAAVIPLRFEQASRAAWTADVSLPIDRAGPLALALLSPDAGNWRVSIGRDAASLLPIAQAFALERRTALAGDDLPGWVVDRYDLIDVEPGEWIVRVEAPVRRGSTPPAQGWLVAKGNRDLRAAAHVSTQRLVAGEPIAVLARGQSDEFAPRVERATCLLESQGRVQELTMQDDGLHEDGARGDGWFGALVPASVRGDVRASVDLMGSTADGQPFRRTAMLSFPVVEERTLLEGSASTRVIDAESVELALGAYPLGPVQRLHVSAEVWGRNTAGRAIPVCWLSRQVDPVERAGMWSLPLFLDIRWLDVARARAPFELRQVRVQDPDTEVVFDRIDRIAITIDELPVTAGLGPREITSDMLTGGSSLTLSSFAHAGTFTRVTPQAIAPALMLVHGYCSGGSIWPAADFTQPKVQFLDPNANRTHDQFAQLIDQRAQSAALSSFGIVAHSQGGPASLHLLTYYESGLDHAAGGRRIQSVASPYQGTPLASLGAFACGVNDNMTPAGSTTWLAGIPTWARAEVYTWTTANSGSVCNFLTSLFLADPEDGTVEKMRSELPGGNNMGHVTGWCHTTGMTNPANYTDHTRNQAMNSAAAR